MTGTAAGWRKKDGTNLGGVLVALPRSAHAYPVLLWTELSTQEGTSIVFPFLFASGDARNFSPSL
ncbi:hypothetical protein CYFUS_003321 [Cystobacter fuscus]|uniref:Uncharacterized protein n=1 Tax=Cystobacter fuscus TaxID=43 RepID=A0A250J3Z5_9BACT|nr:hypothetical protein CYFUS_003321 [Cystobacter fuscus]